MCYRDTCLQPWGQVSVFDVLLCVLQRYLFAAIGTGFCVFDVSPGRERLLVKKLEAHYSKISHLGLASEG